MKRMLTACLSAGLALVQSAFAQEREPLFADDSTRVEMLSESVATAVMASKDAPFAVANISRRELDDFSSRAVELPFLFASTPGVVAWSDNGVGTGTSYLRIRGAADSRINVTLDGVPLNSPEDQRVFWANMNSYSDFLGGAQIQRGVGGSTNGDGAFGGTVALVAKEPSLVPELSVSLSYGSFNTFKSGLNFSSGLIRNRLVIEGAYNETSTDGYIHGTAGRSGSWYAAAAWLGSRFTLRFRHIGNFEHTGQAWNGVESEGESYEDLLRQGLGRYNSLCESYEMSADGPVFTPYLQGATDNFVQHHNILSAALGMGERWKASAALHYTGGSGYYDEFRPDEKLSKFGLSDLVLSDGSSLGRSDLVRKKGLTQSTYGFVASAVRSGERTSLTLGTSLQGFDCNHYGYLTYAGHPELASALLSEGEWQYYDSDAFKGDLSAFAKWLWHASDLLDAYCDLQLRRVCYRTDGVNDKFVRLPDGAWVNQPLDVDVRYLFFNPKAGLSLALPHGSAFASVAVSHREPERNNFTDNGGRPAPSPEMLLDFESGLNQSFGRVSWGMTLYWMRYRDQFVQTGELSDIGEKLTVNIPDSYRAGAEFSLSAGLFPWLSFEGNAALSVNRLLDFDEWVEDWDTGGFRIVHYDSAPLAFSPSAVLNGSLVFSRGGFRSSLSCAYVGRQYLDNTGCADRSIPSFTHVDASLRYSFGELWFLKGVSVGLDLGNLLNCRRAAYAWVYSAVSESMGYTLDSRYTQMGFFPTAGFSAIASLTVSL